MKKIYLFLMASLCLFEALKPLNKSFYSYTKKAMLAAFMLLLSTSVLSQTVKDSVRQIKIDNLYKLALQYKDGKGVEMDYTTAYNYFLQAAELGDAQSIYAVAYMHYKGLGCEQNYDTAAKLFAQGASVGRDNSLYFYGLCWRNGYGRPKNEDSAKYYLKKSADLGYRQAIMELESKVGENSNDSAARVLLEKIHNAAIPNKMELNHFTKVQTRLPSSDIIAGNYIGWIIQYDWSGKYIIQMKKLLLNLNYQDKKITGEWIENEKDTAKINGMIAADSVVFKRTSYNRSDHYSSVGEIKYNFQNAKFNLVQAGDSIFIAGNVEMFSPVRGEPSKPLFVALARPGLKILDSTFLKNLGLSAYPNPFNNILNVQFNLVHSAPVLVELWNMEGKMVYKNDAGVLPEGFYMLPVSNLNIAAGIYFIKFYSGKQSAAIKVIKQND